MVWTQLVFDCTADEAELLSYYLTELDVQAVTLKDKADQPIYEPVIGSTPLWPTVEVTVLLAENDDPQQIITQLNDALQPQSCPPYHLHTLEDKDWVKAGMARFTPQRFGQRLWVCPSWHTPPEPDAINLLLDPGLAFGTGTHPTTALCLQWLDSTPLTGKTVIDYGCGSGILAIAAALLGAKQVIAVDIDPQAIEATQNNAARNQVTIESYLADDYPAGVSDIVLANILAGPLQQLQPLFTSYCHPGSHLVLSGILAEQAETVRHCYANDFVLDATVQQGDWVRITGHYHG